VNCSENIAESLSSNHSQSRENSPSLSPVPTAAVLMAIAIGSAAPTFECQSHTGATLKLADYAGKKLLIWFYPRACTGG
jgi:hypothetical protein